MNVTMIPVNGLDQVAGDLLAWQPTADGPGLACPNNRNPCSINNLGFPKLATQTLGARALFSELDLGDAVGGLLPTADMVNAAGKAVGPTQTSVEDAVRDMTTNPDGITQFADGTSADPGAYPLSMVDYAMVPTCGLSSPEASSIADFLTKVATTGQKQGLLPGEMAPGYYPLNSTQRTQTLKAAAEVKARDCGSAPPDTSVSGQPGANDTTTPKSSASASPSAKPSKAAAGKSPAPSPSTPRARNVAFGQRSADSGLAGLLLLLAIVFGVLLAVGGPTAWVLTVTGRWPVVIRWARRWVRR